jgi:hypothetical protein
MNRLASSDISMEVALWIHGRCFPVLEHLSLIMLIE